MATEITTYQCLACTGPLHFSGESGKLECEYCGSSFSVSEVEAFYREKEKKAAQEAKRREEDKVSENPSGESMWTSEEAAGMRSYSCPSCAAELICDETTAASSCPYCGNPAVVPGQFAGGLKPDLIIPFKLDKEAAKAALLAYYKGKKFLPDHFKEKNHIEEIKGIYVPFWLYDCKVSGQASYNATRVRTYRQGDYRITETSHYLINREGGMEFVRVPVDGSTKMPDAHMDAVEPFDYSGLKPFSTAYLPGFFADKYDVDEKQSAERMNSRVKNSVIEAMKDTVQGYNTVIPGKSSFQVDHSKASYALFPVWMLSTRWNGENFLFAMNGQTGRLVGDLPVDGKKYWTTFLKIMLSGMAILYAIWFGIIL